MKKYILSLLSSLIVISLCGCGSYMDKWADKIVDNMRDNDSGIKSSNAISSILITSSNAVSSDKKLLSMAKWDDDVFESEWAGFKIPLPSGWYKATREEIIQLNQLGAETIAGIMNEDIEKWKSPDSMYPMLILKNKLGIQAKGYNTNFLIKFEKLSNLIVLKDADSYLYYLKAKMESTGMGYIFQDIEHKEIAGQTYSSITATIANKNLKQMQLMRIYDDYMISFIISGSIDNPRELDDLLKSIIKN